jgi:hypothetical protein
MFTNNPFAELSASIPPSVIQTYVIVMIFLVVAGTIFDVLHKKSAKYFFDNWQNARNKGSRQVSGGEMASLAIKTACMEVLTSAEFCTPRRRISHLLTMYGFVAYVITTAIMVFGYPTPVTPTPALPAEGNSPFRVVYADLFILSLLASVTLGLVWSFLQTAGASWWTNLFFGLYVLATTVLFGSVPWSKFAHMFFKPAAAFQKRVAEADGSRSNLPAPADKPEFLGSARRLPDHY